MASDRRAARAIATVLVGLALASLPVHAQPAHEVSAADKETARALMNEGDQKMAASDVQGALKAYRAAHAIMGVPTTGIELARAQLALGLLVEARDTSLEVSRYPRSASEPAPFTRARAEAEQLASTIAPRIPAVRVVVTGPPQGTDLEVSIDGARLPPAAVDLPRKVNPGTRTIRVSARGYTEASASVTLREGELRDVPLTLLPQATSASAPPPPPPPVPASSSSAPVAAPSSPPATSQPPASSARLGDSPRKPALVYGGFGLAVLGVATGGVAGLIALSNASTAKSSCDGELCPDSARGSIVAARNWANVSNIAFAVGVVGAGVGLIALLAAPTTSSAKAPPVDLHLGLGEASMRGRF